MFSLGSIAARIAVGLIRFYQICLSPLKGGGCCRFTPTCSEYSRVAFSRFGFLKGFRLTVIRVLKCQPFYHGCLYDPVPEKKDKDSV